MSEPEPYQSWLTGHDIEDLVREIKRNYDLAMQDEIIFLLEQEGEP